MCLLCNCKTFWKYGGTTIFKYSFTIFIYQINYQAQFNWNYHCYLLRASHILAFIDTSYHPILTATLLQLGTKVNCLTHSFIHSSYFKMFELLICARPFSAWIPALMELRIQRRRQLINDRSFYYQLIIIELLYIMLLICSNYLTKVIFPRRLQMDGWISS